MENHNAVDEKPLLNGIAEKESNEAEHMTSVNNSADDLKLGLCKGEKNATLEVAEDSRNADDTLLPFGSKVMIPMKTLTLSPEKEISKKEAECVTVGVKEEIKSLPLLLVDTCQFNDSVPNSPNKAIMECQNRSDNVQSESIINEDDVINENVKGETSNEDDAVNENVKSACEVKNGKRGRKRKVLETSGDVTPKKEKIEKDGVKVNRRVLRSNTMTVNDVVKVDENESVAGFKRQMEAECLGQSQTEHEKEVNAKSQPTGRPQKKQKRRGRPPKIQGETGSKRKIKNVCLDENALQKEVDENISITGKQQKKQKRIGRPPKDQSEKLVLHKVTVINNQKRPGRPPKGQDGNLSTHVTNAKKQNTNNQVKGKNVKDSPKIHNVQNEDESSDDDIKLKIKTFEENNNQTTIEETEKSQTTKQLKGTNVKDSPKIHNVQNEDESSEDDNKLKIKTFEESNNQTTVEETEKSQTTKQLKNSFVGLEKRQEQQLVRDKIVSIIVKAGWNIEYRKRLTRDYKDAVYVDQKGKTHWSVTKAYFCLLKKIENGLANSQEISAFTPIPDEEMSLLFRSVSKVRSDKNMKKNRIKKGKNKAEIIIRGVAQLRKYRKKSAKKGKNVIKKKPSTLKRGPKVKPRLVARKEPDEQNADCTLFDGKRNLLSWMIDSGVILPGGKLQYSGLEGTITHDGINCNCCNEIMDISSFVKHCGGKGVENIYLECGSSFLKCLLECWRKEENSGNIRFNDVDVSGDDPNDDTCNICGDGGDLICCDGCPSTFHQSCLDIQDFPSGEWRCVYCCCKFCGLVGCDASRMLTCCLCEEKFHHLCLQQVDSSSLAFCGSKCQEIHEQLQKYIGVKFELEDGYSWSLLKRCDVSQVFALIDDQPKIECNSKLAVAFSVMDECFVPIMDERSRVNVIHNVVYNCGSNFKRLDYSGFFTAILERGGELISAASIRIHGHRLAEMPFIGTRNMYRRQGMCHRLLDAIESALSCIGVGELVIPAIPELYKTWTKVFGFKPLEESKRQTMKCMSMIVFPGTDMLHKPLLNNKFPLNPVTNDDNALHSETKSSDHKQTLVISESNVVKTCPLTCKRITFDLNLQPAATDTDFPSIDDDSISQVWITGV